MLVTAQRVIERGFSYGEADHYAFMLLCFLMKQFEHIRSVAILVDAGQYRDATAIARMMLEGMSTLLWAARDSETRPLQWRAYALVSDWELLKHRKESGEYIDSDHEKQLSERLQKHGPNYFTKSARRDGPDGLDQPFQKTWQLDPTGSQITRSAIFEEIKGSNLIAVYKDFSQWVHWTPRAFGECIERQEDDRTAYNPNAYLSAAQALAVAIQAIIETLRLVYEHFKIESKPNLDELRDEYLKDIDMTERGDR
jgi:hypothetical protein